MHIIKNRYHNLFGQGAVFGQNPYPFGASTVGGDGLTTNNIVFKDPINFIYIGSDYLKQSPAYILMDNLRISNKSRELYTLYGENLDVNYSSNINNNFPVESDLYTTFLQNYDETKIINTNTATLIADDSNDFSITIYDEFGLVSNSAQVKAILEQLINTLSPGTSRPFIKYA